MRRWALLAVAVGLAAGCKKTLHWRIVEGRLAAMFGHAIAVADIACDESEVRAGTRFACHVHSQDGATTDVHVELTDQVGGAKLVERGFRSPASTATLIRTSLHDKYQIDADVDCGKGLLITGHHECSAHAGDGSSGRIAVDLHDDSTFDWKAIADK
jgi:hypothetical protein